MAEPFGLNELGNLIHEKTNRLMVNGTGGFIAWGIEFARWSQINLRGRARPGLHIPLPQEPYLSIFQSLGDVGPGFMMSVMAYEAIDLLATPAEAVTGKRIPEEMKVGAAVLLGIAGIVAHENNLFMGGNWATGSMADILGGSLGPIAFIGFRMLVDRYIEKVDKKIEILEMDKGDNDIEISPSI